MADINAAYYSLLAADEAGDTAAVAAVAWQIYGQLATTAADLGALPARFRVYTAAPQASGRRRSASGRAQTGADLSCADDPELFFAESPDDVETAKALCRECPARPPASPEHWSGGSPGESGAVSCSCAARPCRISERGDAPARRTWLPSNQRETGVRVSEQQPGGSRRQKRTRDG